LTYYSYSSTGQSLRILVGNSINPDAIKKLLPAAASGNNISISHYNPESTIYGWPEDRLAFTNYDAIVVSSSDMSALPGNVINAINAYVHAGGILIVSGSWEIPTFYGKPSITKPAYNAYYYGYGELYHVIALETISTDKSFWNDIYTSISSADNIWIGTNNLSNLNSELPIVKESSLTVLAILGFIVLFVIVAGPANLLVLSKFRKKIWLFWTVPLLSIVTSVGISVFALVSEGITGRSTMQSCTLLDQNTHTATTIGRMAIYTPLTPNEGLRFSYNTELYLLGHSDSYKSGSTPVSVDWTECQHLTAGWVRARIPAQFRIIKNETRRERVTFRRSGNSIIAVNGLGTDLSNLRYADSEGRIFSASEIKSGQEVELSETKFQSNGSAAVNRKEYLNKSWLWLYGGARDKPQDYLFPNSYIAQLADSPFVEKPLKNAKMSESRSIIFGITGGAQDEN
jgi:hypothetical protein